MRRRALLACSLPVAIAGCIGDTPVRGDDETDGGENESDSGGNESGSGGNESGGESNETGDGGDGGVESRYRVVVEAPESNPGDGSVCEFESLPDAAQEEFEAAVEGVNFETTDRGEYTSESLTLLDTDCYNAYVAYEGEYYWVSVDAEGG